jgi:5-methyltetrahydrofolate--homocysteine methyltransferase
MEKKAGSHKGTIVLATVKGDVHDIGKNLVDIILSNNGFKVVNLGIKQPGDSIIRAAQEHQANAIGLSGLLVKSTLEMRYVIQDLERQKLQFPVICGGAALTRKYVEDDLRREYANAVFYADDAFAGLHIMEDLSTENGAKETRLTEGRTVKEYSKAAAVDEETGPVFAERSPVVVDAPNIPAPPFWGVRVRKDYDLRELFRYINETALFKNQWQLKTASQADYVRLVNEKFRPILFKLEDEVADYSSRRLCMDTSLLRPMGTTWWFMSLQMRSRDAPATAGETPALLVPSCYDLHSHGSAKDGGCASRISLLPNPQARWT